MVDIQWAGPHVTYLSTASQKSLSTSISLVGNWGSDGRAACSGSGGPMDEPNYVWFQSFNTSLLNSIVSKGISGYIYLQEMNEPVVV